MTGPFGLRAAPARPMLLVEVWTDIVCPWCYVGKRRLETALAGFDGADVTVRFRSFELDPLHPPVVAGSIHDRLAAKMGGTVEAARAMTDRVADAAAADGLDLRFDAVRPASSFDAHRLVQWAQSVGLGGPMVERLHRAHFTEGEVISDRAVLARLAGEIGLDEGDAGRMLLAGDYADGVREDEDLAAQLGIRGVPFFVLDRRYGISGAQPAEALLAALRQALTDRSAAED